MSAEVEAIRNWARDPVRFVREVFKVEPDKWQSRVLTAFPKHPRLAMQACKGPGKTTVLAWLVWNFLLTRPYPKVICTSITGDNLADGLWTELAKWQRHSSILTSAFTWTKTAITCNEAPAEWYAVARTWPRTGDANQQADTLAGKHADYMLFVLDEVGGIPDAVMAAAEAGLANSMGGGGVEAHIVIAGNPTHNSGPLFRSCTSERSLWWHISITADPDDPERTPRVSAEWARQQIQKYGRDNPWVLVNVFGRFPPSSINTLLGPEEVREAMQRFYREHEFSAAPKILGVDVAREGDDASVIFSRQGQQAFKPIVLRNVTSIVGAGYVARKWQDWGADGCFVDNTGGFGGGWVDQLSVLGLKCSPIHFAGSASDGRYANKRAEMWFLMAEWVKAGGALPDLPELVEELTAPTYTFQGDRLLLEPKDDIKERIGRSPDHADALALTFAHPVIRQQTQLEMARQLAARTPEPPRGKYDPFAAAELRRWRGQRR